VRVNFGENSTTVLFDMYNALSTIFLCVPFIFADSNLAVLPFATEIVRFFIVVTLIAKELFRHLLIYTAV